MYFQKTKWTTAKKCEYNGYIYDSKFESSYAQELDLRVKARDILRWEKQVKIPLEVNGFHICNYYIDFVVYHTNGEVEFCETKGWMTEVWKLKWRIFEALFSNKPNTKLTVITQGKQQRIPKARRVKKKV